MGRLFILATPIGNLGDVTLRGLAALKEADLILAEDTRVTAKLLQHYQIKKSLFSCHQHSSDRMAERVAQWLKEGKKIVLVTDAGTPGISDPGEKLISQLWQKLGADFLVTALPGANAALTALSISGFPADQFLFLGFPPHKKGRQTFFQKMTQSDCTVVFYESPHRILKILQDLAKVCPERPLVIARELTKKFETIYRGTVEEILKKHQTELTKGELTLVIKPKD